MFYSVTESGEQAKVFLNTTTPPPDHNHPVAVLHVKAQVCRHAGPRLREDWSPNGFALFLYDWSQLPMALGLTAPEQLSLALSQTPSFFQCPNMHLVSKRKIRFQHPVKACVGVYCRLQSDNDS